MPDKNLIADSLKNDPRILEGKKLIMEALYSSQKKTLTVQPPRKELQQSYTETIDSFQNIRAGNLYFPFLGSGWGRGPFVELLDGSIKYDMICGIGPHFWGHSYPPLIEVAIVAALNDTIMQGHLQQNQDAF